MTDQTAAPRRFARLRVVRERHPSLSPYLLRKMIAAGVVAGCRPAGTRSWLIDLDDLDRVVREGQNVAAN